jgi:hypothetical protein
MLDSRLGLGSLQGPSAALWWRGASGRHVLPSQPLALCTTNEELSGEWLHPVLGCMLWLLQEKLRQEREKREQERLEQEEREAEARKQRDKEREEKERQREKEREEREKQREKEREEREKEREKERGGDKKDKEDRGKERESRKEKDRCEQRAWHSRRAVIDATATPRNTMATLIWNAQLRLARGPGGKSICAHLAAVSLPTGCRPVAALCCWHAADSSVPLMCGCRDSRREDSRERRRSRRSPARRRSRSRDRRRSRSPVPSYRRRCVGTALGVLFLHGTSQPR